MSNHFSDRKFIILLPNLKGLKFDFPKVNFSFAFHETCFISLLPLFLQHAFTKAFFDENESGICIRQGSLPR